MERETLRAIREANGEKQEDFAKRLNAVFNRKYDKSRISRWESGDENIPADVSGFLELEGLSFQRRKFPLVLSQVNQKGGVGKSFLTGSLGFVLAKACKRPSGVLIIDCDSQANATLGRGVTRAKIKELDGKGQTLYHALMGKCDINDIIVKATDGGPDVIPSSIRLAAAERDLIEREIRDGVWSNGHLRDLIRQIKTDYDFILLDCMPSLGVLTINALMASQHVLVPVQCETLAIIGLDNLAETIQFVRMKNPALKILGIVPTMYTARHSQDRESLQEIHDIASSMNKLHVFDPIPRSTQISQAASANVCAYSVDPGIVGLDTIIAIAAKLGVCTAGAKHGVA
jgi:chromosome partitioning protein